MARFEIGSHPGVGKGLMREWMHIRYYINSNGYKDEVCQAVSTKGGNNQQGWGGQPGLRG